MTRFIFVLLVLVALVVIAWPYVAPTVESTFEDLTSTAEADGLPEDWEGRYDEVVASLRDRARELFQRQVDVRADRIEASRAQAVAREGLRDRERVLDSLAGVIRDAAEDGRTIEWEGRSFETPAAARATLMRWEEELLEGERALTPIARQTASLDEAERALGSACSQLRARADQLERERSIRKANLDAAAARRELRTVREVNRALDADPSLDELHRIVGLIDRELVVAEAWESLEAEEGGGEGSDTLADAASSMERKRRRAAIEERVERRLRGGDRP